MFRIDLRQLVYFNKWNIMQFHIAVIWRPNRSEMCIKCNSSVELSCVRSEETHYATFLSII